MQDLETFDVVVIGSGAAGAMAALRSADQGLKVLIVEKAQKFGGTSATSGGVLWIPNHQLDGDKGDTREAALEYLDSIIGKPVNRARLEAFVARAGPTWIAGSLPVSMINRFISRMASGRS